MKKLILAGAVQRGCDMRHYYDRTTGLPIGVRTYRGLPCVTNETDHACAKRIGP
jgi:hypothetical protein